MAICPLTGKPCDNQKCISVTDVEDGKAVKSSDLCLVCGHKYLYASLPQPEPEPEPEPIQQAVAVIATAAELYDLFVGKGIPVQPVEQKPPCPKCGLTLAEFNTIGKFGCATCYEHYIDEFLALAGPFQNGSDRHIGKCPKNFYADPNPNVELMKLLKLKFAKAVEVERYEEAAVLKKEIDDLTQRISSENKRDDALGF